MADLAANVEERLSTSLSTSASLTNASTIWVVQGQQSAARAFLTAAANLVGLITGERGVHYQEAQKVLANEHLERGVPISAVTAMRGILFATKEDFEHGLLTSIAYQSYAITFDDFLDHAADLHKEQKLVESAILASAVFEDVMRRIAERHDVHEKNMEQRIDALAKKDVFTGPYVKRIKSWSAVRTSAFHARWEELDLKTVGAAIAGIRELIESHLT